MREFLCLSVRLAPAAATFAALSLIAALPRPSHANQICADGTSTCVNSSALTEDHMRRRVDRTLAVGTARDRASRLNMPGTAMTVPFDMTPDGTNANFETSLSQWRSSLSAADQATLKKAAETSGQSLPLPQMPQKAVQKFDIWAEGRREVYGQDPTKQGDALTTFVGADYRMNKDLLVGGMVQLDEGRQTVFATPDAAQGTAYLAGPYVAYRVTPHVLLDAKTAWGAAADTAITGANTMAYGTERMLSEAKLSGQWGWRGWNLNQSGAVTYLDESSYGIAGLQDTSVGMTRLSVGPELKRSFQTGEKTSIEPFAFFKSSVDVTDADLVDTGVMNTVGGGLTLANPDSFNVRATADYSENTSGTTPGVGTGKVQINVPTSLFGF